MFAGLRNLSFYFFFHRYGSIDFFLFSLVFALNCSVEKSGGV